VCAPDAELLERFIGAARGRLRLITVAPEREGALALIGRAAEQGLRVALGHTDAGFEESLRAFEEGASHVTHAFNAMRPFHHREPGPVGAALRSGATVEVIADGVHLHPAVVQLLVAALGPERVALVSDAVSAAGLGAGEAVIGGQRARVEGGRVVLPDGTLAGSASTLAEAVRDVVRWTGASLCEVSRMASGTPSRLLGLEAETGALRAGLRADIVAVDEEMRVTHTWCGGRLVYRGG
jgi:N-acetylglucosamine-6-phosphate deacetylase